MLRPIRIEFAGALYDIASRGDGQEEIYRGDEDRERFLGVLGEACEGLNWTVHAWCRMTNHLLVETPDGNLSKGMRHLNGVYTQRFNRRHQRVGHVFQGRFKAILAGKERDLLELIGSVHRSEPGAGGDGVQRRALVLEQLSVHPGLAPSPPWLDRDWLLGGFGSRRDVAVRKYREFVADGVQQPSPWRILKQQIFLGGDGFVARSQAGVAGKSPSEMPKIQRRPRPKPLEFYTGSAANRHGAMFLAYRGGGYTLKEIGDYFVVHYSTVSRVLKELASAQERSDPEFLGFESGPDPVPRSDDFPARNFAETFITVEMPKGGTKSARLWEMTKDGFMFLVMGFTGQKAGQVKEAYINAFNLMAERLANPEPKAALPAKTEPRTVLDLDYVRDLHHEDSQVRNVAWWSFERVGGEDNWAGTGTYEQGEHFFRQTHQLALNRPEEAERAITWTLMHLIGGSVEGIGYYACELAYCQNTARATVAWNNKGQIPITF